MRPITRLILIQEIYVAVFAAFLGLVVSIEKGQVVGLRTFIFVFLLMQVVLVLLNYRLVWEKVRFERKHRR